MESPWQDAYREDLAFIHDVGFGSLARAAAPVLLGELRRGGFTAGRVLDLGCGSGILGEPLAAAGFDVWGLDLSPAMVALARQRVPSGEFRVGSILTAAFPPCVAIAACGEIVNYLFDETNSKAGLARLIRRAYDALVPGGVLLFDAAGPGRVPGGTQRQFRLGEDWAVLVEAREDSRQKLVTRAITSFRKVGDQYRRDDETHRLRLIPGAELSARLRRTGFRVRTNRHYGPLDFPPGLTAYTARKPR